MIKRLTTLPALAGLLLVLQACASAGGGATQQAAPLRDRTLITAGEIDAMRLPDLHSVVRTLHPEWLRPDRSGGIGVFLNGVRRGGPEVLAELSVTSNVQIRYLDQRAIQRELTDLAARGLATAILVEEGTLAELEYGEGRVANIPEGLHLTLTASPQYTATELDHPFAGDANYTLQSEERTAAGWTAAARLGYRGVYVEPFYTSAERTNGGVYEHDTGVRNMERSSSPQLGVMLGFEHSFFRAGVGMATETVTWSWAGGECRCYSRGSMEESYTVPLAEVAARLPLWRMVGAELRVTGRRRPETEISMPHLYPAVTVRDGGTEVDVALGLSARLF